MATSSPTPRPAELGFIGRILVIAIVIVVMLAVWKVAPVFMIGFGGIVVAVALNNIAAPLARRTGLPPAAALTIVVVALALVAIGFFALFGAAATAQFAALLARLPGAWQEARDWLESWALGRWILSTSGDALSGAASTIFSALSIAGGFLGGLGNAALILVVGIYLAADPVTYRNGILRLLPPARRPRADEIMNATGDALRKWLTAMTLDMVFLGILTGVGLWLIGVPFSFSLGILSGLSVFVPYIGPIVATLPGLLLALSVSPSLALYAFIVYVVAQQLEGNISLPLLQRWTVQMPPAVSLLAMVGFGLLFGLWGVLLATPMAVATLTIVRMSYVEDMLERPGYGG